VFFLALIFPKRFQNFTGIIRNSISVNFDWFYLLVVAVMIIVCFGFMFTPAGKIKLGDPASQPEHSTASWLAMLFSAGMGIGLVFYGAAEPLSHYLISSPEAPEGSQQALRDSFKYSMLHYGLHPWAVYAIVALALAYFQFRKKEKTLISVTLKPLFGQKMDGIFGKIIDSVTIFATVAGVSTTLGFGAAQINGGLSYLFNVPNSFQVQVIIIIVATGLFMASALSGIGKGVKILSNLNMILASVLLILAFLVGPRVKILNTMVQTIGLYLSDLLRMSFRTSVGNPQKQEWIQNWTIMYWSWWISWSPFVGIFIARISKGRTIKQFVTYVLFVPTLFSLLWFTVFGGLSTNIAAIAPELKHLALENVLFATFSHYHLGTVMSVISIVLVFSFFITSADSATFVLAMQSQDGILNPSNKVKALWGILLSSIAIALMMAGGLKALQNLMIIIAFPFSIILILVMVSMIKELKYERQMMGLYLKPRAYPSKNAPFRSYEDDDMED
jgi:glycine betaine transporter